MVNNRIPAGAKLCKNIVKNVESCVLRQKYNKFLFNKRDNKYFKFVLPRESEFWCMRTFSQRIFGKGVPFVLLSKNLKEKGESQYEQYSVRCNR